MKKRKPIAKIYLETPVNNKTWPDNSMCMLGAYDTLTKEGYHIATSYLMQESLISRGRNTIAHKFLKEDYDYLMMIDSDIIYRATDIIRLIKHDLPVVGGNYRHKTTIAERWAGNPQDRKIPVSESEHVPTGFILIKRKVFYDLLKYKKKHPKFNLEWYNMNLLHDIWGFFVPWIDKEKRIYLSEDWAFSKRCMTAGIKCYIDNMISLQHIGRIKY